MRPMRSRWCLIASIGDGLWRTSVSKSSTGVSTHTTYVHSDGWRTPIRFIYSVIYLTWEQFPGREEVFESWPMGFHKVRNKTCLLYSIFYKGTQV